MKKDKKWFLLLSALIIGTILNGQTSSFQIALMKYSGGGDWYADPTALPNLIKFCNEEMGTQIAPEPATVEPGSPDIFNYPFIHLTGHGNVIFNQREVDNLRKYLMGGGFLHIDDNYGLDPYIRPQMKKVFPELDFVELPFDHPLYLKPFPFPDGLPKIHVHDGKPPQGFALIWEGRVVCYYTYETDLSDGWEDAAVHNNSEETRRKSLKMGANLIHYSFSQ